MPAKNPTLCNPKKLPDQPEDDAPLIEWARYYATINFWPIFPCRFDKRPYTMQGVLDATTDPEQIRKWWTKWPKANIGLDVGGAGMMVLDLDPGHDLVELDRNLGGLPETELWQATPRGGKHLFYTLDRDDPPVAGSASKLAPNVDVRSFHSYVLLAPSTTKDGTYDLHEGKPAYRTVEMIRLANSAREKHEDRDNWTIEPDLPENIEAAITYFKDPERCKPAIEGQGGDNMAYKTAAMCKSYGLSPEKALELMWEHWNPRCVPPWVPDEIDHLETKVRNAYAYNTSPPGNLTPAYKAAKTREFFKPVEEILPSGRQRSRGKFRIVDRDGMEHIQPPSWLIRDFIQQEAYALLFGPPGTFKTFIALDIALSAAAGFLPQDAMWFNGIVTPGPVLFAAGEGRSKLKKRVAAWERKNWGGHKVQDFTLIDPVPSVSAEAEWGDFIALAKELHPDGYKLVVIDTIGRSMQGVNENAQEHASKFTKQVEAFQRELGATVLAIHHTGHDDKNKDRARGSSVFGADADTVIRVDRQGKDYLVSMHMTKQKDAPEWKKPKYVRLDEVHLSPEEKSLVAAPGAGGAEVSNLENRSKHHPEGNPAALEVIDKAIEAVLSLNPTKRWTTIDLAEALAMREEINVESSTLARRTLKRLREDNGRQANKLYYPQQKIWRWQK